MYLGTYVVVQRIVILYVDIIDHPLMVADPWDNEEWDRPDFRPASHELDPGVRHHTNCVLTLLHHIHIQSNYLAVVQVQTAWVRNRGTYNETFSRGLDYRICLGQSRQRTIAMLPKYLHGVYRSYCITEGR